MKKGKKNFTQKKRYVKTTNDERHPIPKEQQIKQTPEIQELCVYMYLEERAFHPIEDACGIERKNGDAIKAVVNKLFRGKYKANGIYHPYNPLFTKLRDRTNRPWRKREITCIGWAAAEKFSLQKIANLTGRYDLGVLQKQIDVIMQKENTLY